MGGGPRFPSNILWRYLPDKSLSSGVVYKGKQLRYRLGCNISSMRSSVSSLDKTLRRELKITPK